MEPSDLEGLTSGCCWKGIYIEDGEFMCHECERICNAFRGKKMVFLPEEILGVTKMPPPNPCNHDYIGFEWATNGRDVGMPSKFFQIIGGVFTSLICTRCFDVKKIPDSLT